MNDEQIILLFNLRNEQAIAETEKKYGTICRKNAGKILNSQQDIEECVNDTSTTTETTTSRHAC